MQFVYLTKVQIYRKTPIICTRNMYEQCKTLCKTNLTNEHRSMMIILDYFLRVHSMLTNYVDFLESRRFEHGRSALCQKLPLQGALKILNKLMPPDVDFRHRRIEAGNDRPGLFVESFSSTCRKSIDLSINIADKIEITIKHLTASLTKTYSTQTVSILFALVNLLDTPLFETLKILSQVLSESANDVTHRGQPLEEPPAHIQTKTLLNLVSNFIREWGERPSEAQARLKICKFCDSVVNDKTQRNTEKLCCDKAEHFHGLSNEWILLYASQNPAISRLANLIKCESNYNDKSCSRKKDLFATIVNSNNTGMQLMSTNKENMSALEEHYYRNHASSQTNPKRGDTKVCNNAESISANEDALLALEDHYRNGIVSQRRGNSDSSVRVVCDNRRNIADTWIGVTNSKEVGQSGTGHRDGLTDKTLSVPNGERLSRRGRAETSAGGARSSGVGARNTDAVAPLERIREKRDNNPYRRKHDKAEDKDRQDRRAVQRDVQERADGSRIASGKRGGDTESGAEETADERGNPNRRSSYRRGKEHGTRSSDKSGGERRRIGGRLDRAEEESTSTGQISANPGKRDENGERDQHVNEEKPVARGSGNRGELDKDREITTPLSKSEESRRDGGKKDSSDESAEERRSVVNKEGQLRAVDEISRSTPTGEGYDSNRSNSSSSLNTIRYHLSNARFMELGWTVLPSTKIMRKIIQYEANPAKPNLWFKKFQDKGIVYYDNSQTPFLKFYPDGSGELFYPNGVLAVKIYRPKNREYDMYTVFTPGGKDALGIERRSQILAVFDTLGNGVVFDEDGATRLSYNQIGGIFTDNPTGLPLAWTWKADSRESILEDIYSEENVNWMHNFFSTKENKAADSSGNVRTPISQSSPRNRGKKVEEPVVEKRQEEVGDKSHGKQEFPKEKLYHIKIICLKLNEFLSLRIVDQRNISLRFLAGNKNIRMELGTIVNFNKEVASRVIEARDWKSDMLKCRFQENLSKTLKSDNSLYDIAKAYRKVKAIARKRKLLIHKYKPFS